MLLHRVVAALTVSVALTFSPTLYCRPGPRLYAKDVEWPEAELSIQTLEGPQAPTLGPQETVLAVVRSLQFNDMPKPNSGLERVFSVFTWECRKAVAHRSDEPDSIDRFVKYGSVSPKLQYFAGATNIEFGVPTSIDAVPPTRGAMYHQPVRVHAKASLAVAHASGLERSGVATPPIRDFIMCLRQERRPPRAGMWLVNEVLDCKSFEGDVHLES